MSGLSLVAALQKAQSNKRERRLNGAANMVGKVIEYERATVHVEIVFGVLQGQKIHIDPNNLSIKDLKTESDEQTSPYTPVGGLLRFERVEKLDNGDYKSGWTNSFAKRHDDIEFNQTAKVIHGRSGGKPYMQVQMLDVENEATVFTLKDVTEKLVEAFESAGSATLFMRNETEFGSSYLFPRPEQQDDGSYEIPDFKQYAESLFEGMSEAERKTYEADIAKHGLSIVPTKSIPVGPKTAFETDKKIQEAAKRGSRARLMVVNVNAYKAPSLGARMAGAINRLDGSGEPVIHPDDAEMLSQDFLASASEKAAEAFAANGWRAVDERDIRRYFETRGIKLGKHPDVGYNSSVVALQKFKGSENVMASQTFEQFGSARPYPPIKYCEDLFEDYRREMPAAIEMALEEIQAEKSAKKSSEAKAPSAGISDAKKEGKKTEKAQPAKTEVDAKTEAENQQLVDDLLGDMDNEPMG